MRKKNKIGIIGFGNMGSACASALQAQGSWQVYTYDIRKDLSSTIKGVNFCSSLKELFSHCKIIILAIKPQDILNFLKENKEYFSIHKPLCISIAAGISTKSFEKYIPKLKIIRTMPNLAAKVLKSFTFICKGKFAGTDDLKIAKNIFLSIGEVILISEDMINKATSISGNGPGYVYYFMHCIKESAVKLGFTEDIAQKMVLQVFLGALDLAKNSQDKFHHLVQKVCSPKGSTEAAIKYFNENKLEELIYKGIHTAYKRAEEISMGSDLQTSK